MKFKLRPFVSALLLLTLFATTQAKQRGCKYWIEFTDKGISSSSFLPGTPLFEQTIASLSMRTLERRSAALHTTEPLRLVTLDDVPISTNYILALQHIGIHVLAKATWENVVSAMLTDTQAAALRTLPFVRSIHPVAETMSNSVKTISHITPAIIQEAENSMVCGYDSIIYHYGFSDWILRSINVLPLHEMRFDGSGVPYGIIDCGFNWRHMRTTANHRVHGEYDFVFGDSVTSNEANDIENQDGHGSLVLSTATGYLPDSVIGPAYNPDLWLAKTEDLRSETPREEDNFAAALEWMESQGVDIVSSSLGYRNFDSGFVSYQYSDMNGTTAISSRAATRAASLGMLVCMAAGNNRQTDPPSLMAPSDADSILSCGALQYNDTIADFSSNGPSADGRIKPEICAPGVYIPTILRDDSLGYETGTSLATPLISGACVLIKQAHPEASSMQIRNAVIASARSISDSLPNNIYGYGKIDAYNAALSLGTIIGKVTVSHIDSIYSICVPIAANNGIRNPQLFWSIDTATGFHSADLQLATDSLIYSGTFPALSKGTVVNFYLSVRDGADTLTRSPRDANNFYSFTVGDSSPVHLGVEEQTTASMIFAYPNPANDYLTVRTSTNEAMQAQLCDNLGRVVRTIDITAGEHSSRLSVASLPNGAYRLLARLVSGTVLMRTIVIAR